MAKEDHEDLKSNVNYTMDVSRRISKEDDAPLSADEARKLTEAQYAVDERILTLSLKYAYVEIRKAAKAGNRRTELFNFIWDEGGKHPTKKATWDAVVKELFSKGFSVNHIPETGRTSISW